MLKCCSIKGTKCVSALIFSLSKENVANFFKVQDYDHHSLKTNVPRDMSTENTYKNMRKTSKIMFETDYFFCHGKHLVTSVVQSTEQEDGVFIFTVRQNN